MSTPSLNKSIEGHVDEGPSILRNEANPPPNREELHNDTSDYCRHCSSYVESTHICPLVQHLQADGPQAPSWFDVHANPRRSGISAFMEEPSVQVGTNERCLRCNSNVAEDHICLHSQARGFTTFQADDDIAEEP